MNMSEIIPLLREIVGAEYVSDDPMTLLVYSRDYSSLPAQKAQVIVLPGCTEEVSEIMRLANKTGTPVTVRGGATTAALSTSKEGIILDLNRMNKILKIDTEGSLYLTAQAGCAIYTITQELDKLGFILAGRPMFGPVASIGSWVNTVGIGGGCNRYGYFSENITGIEVVLPTGEIVRTGVNSLQNCDPYCRYTHASDLTGIFVGSRGSMGVVTEVSTRIFPKEPCAGFITMGYNTDEDLVRATNLLFKADVAENIDINDWSLGKFVDMEIPAKHMLNVVVQGVQAEVDRKLQVCRDIIAQTNGIDMGPDIAALIFYGSGLTAYVYKKEGYGHLVFCDSYWHSIDAYPALYESFTRILDKYGLHMNCIFGWFMKGVGCSFPIVAYKEPDDRDAMNAAWKEICDEWFAVKDSAPGMSVTSPTNYNLDPLRPSYYWLLRKIKDVVDPKNIMNSKVIPSAGRMD